MSAISKKIEKVFRDFGIDTAIALKESVDQALSEGGRTSPQTVKLDFTPNMQTTPEGDVILEIGAVNGKKPVKYWGAIEEGRNKHEKRIPADVVGKQWQNQYNIDPRVVLLSIIAKRVSKKKGLNYKPSKFTKLKKTLDYDKSAKTLSFIFQNSIYNKGIKPKPFVDRVLDDGRIQKLRQDLTPLLGEKFKLIIKGLEL